MSYSDLPTDEILDRPPLPPGCGFENGELVPLAREPEPDDSERLAELLEDHGMPPAQIPNAAAALEELIGGLAVVRAAQSLRHIARCLAGSGAGVALDRVLCGADGETLREAAERAGCSHVSVDRQERKIEARLRGGGSNSLPIVMNLLTSVLNAVRAQRPAAPPAEPILAMRIENPRPEATSEARTELARAYPEPPPATNRQREALADVSLSAKTIAHLAKLAGVELVTPDELMQFKTWHAQWRELNVAVEQAGWDAVSRAYRAQFTGDVPIHANVQTKEDLNNQARLVRAEIRGRQKAVMREALPVLEVIRARLARVGHEVSQRLESAERQQASDFGVAFRPSEMLRAAQKIAIASDHFVDSVSESPTSPWGRLMFVLPDGTSATA